MLGPENTVATRRAVLVAAQWNTGLEAYRRAELGPEVTVVWKMNRPSGASREVQDCRGRTVSGSATGPRSAAGRRRDEGGGRAGAHRACGSDDLKDSWMTIQPGKFPGMPAAVPLSPWSCLPRAWLSRNSQSAGLCSSPGMCCSGPARLCGGEGAGGSAGHQLQQPGHCAHAGARNPACCPTGLPALACLQTAVFRRRRAACAASGICGANRFVCLTAEPCRLFVLPAVAAGASSLGRPACPLPCPRAPSCQPAACPQEMAKQFANKQGDADKYSCFMQATEFQKCAPGGRAPCAWCRRPLSACRRAPPQVPVPPVEAGWCGGGRHMGQPRACLFGCLRTAASAVPCCGHIASPTGCRPTGNGSPAYAVPAWLASCSTAGCLKGHAGAECSRTPRRRLQSHGSPAQGRQQHFGPERRGAAAGGDGAAGSGGGGGAGVQAAADARRGGGRA